MSRISAPQGLPALQVRASESRTGQAGAIKPVFLVVGGVILVIVVIGIASGALKFKESVSLRGGPSLPPSQPEQLQPEQPEASPATQTYENTSLGMTLAYPEGWSLKENPAAGVVVAFGSPKESVSDTFVDNINISVSDLSSQPEMTLDEIVDLWRKQTEGALPAGAFRLLEIKPATLAGAEAKRLVYTYNAQGREIKGLVVLARKGDTAYIVTYSAENTSYDKFVGAADAIVSSFQVE